MTAPDLMPGEDDRWKVLAGDTLALLPQLPDHSIDAVVSDPPYGIDFQAEAWDGKSIRTAAHARTTGPLTPGQAFEAWTSIWASELARVVKPGGHIACFAATRMAHRLTSGMEDAGLEIRDTLMWLYGQGMPKSRRLPHGRGTALKPAYEPIILARTPQPGTTKDTIEQHGTGALNIDACRIPSPPTRPACERRSHRGGRPAQVPAEGRWPANIVLSHHPDCTPHRCVSGCAGRAVDEHADRGGTRPAVAPSRIFYCAKASRTERDAGCEQLPGRRLDLFPSTHTKGGQRTVHNPHPTVKPIELMRWLTRLITPDGGLVLDPFCGSGSTGIAAVLEDRRFLGIERDPDHHQVATARINHWHTTHR